MNKNRYLLLFAIFTHSLFAQTSEVAFKTIDNITINATFHLAKKSNKKSPVIILIHQGGSSKKEWLENAIWQQLINKGYSLLAYDIRQHGKSEKDNGTMYNLFNNPKRAPLDVLAAIHFLQKNKSIDANRIGILGASIGANLAAVASFSDAYAIKSVVVLSAKTSAIKNLSGLKNTSLTFKNVFFIASEQEQNGKRKKWAKELFSYTTKHKKVTITKGSKHGSYILREHKYVIKEIIEWFDKTL